MVFAEWYHVDTNVSLAVISAILVAAVVLSERKTRQLGPTIRLRRNAGEGCVGSPVAQSGADGEHRELRSMREVCMSDRSLPVAAALVRYQVADFDQWKVGFDKNEGNRIKNGFVGHHVNRAENDLNSLSIYFAIGDVEMAAAYAESEEVKALMEEAGIMSAPEVLWLKPVAESAIWDRQLPGVVISHTVDDFDAWLAGYLGADAMRESAGVIGHAANQGMDNPSLALVYQQAESFDTLRALAASDELRTVMKEAGVNSEPEFTYHTGGWGKLY